MLEPTNNIFIQLFRRLRHWQLSIRKKFAILFTLILGVFGCLFAFIAHEEISAGNKHLAYAFGKTIAHQLAESAASLITSGDQLSLNVLLNQLVSNPYIYSAEVFSVDNRLLATVKTKSKLNSQPYPTIFSTPVHYQNVLVGHIRVRLDKAMTTKPAREAMFMVILSGVLLLICGLILLMRQTHQLTFRLKLLANALNRKDERILHTLSQSTHPDEIGSVQRALSAILPPPEGETTQKHVQQTAIVGVHLHNLTTLQQYMITGDFQDLLSHFTEILQVTTDEYDGQLSFTADGHAVVHFSDTQSFSELVNHSLSFINTLENRRKDAELDTLKIGCGVALELADQQTQENAHPLLAHNPLAVALQLASIAKTNPLIHKDDLSFCKQVTFEASPIGPEAKIFSLYQPSPEPV
ncbi:hypothetical protein [Zooshikella harenae]|uniref:Guanylate cyclase domain-containing protein n=1 Tax=Zooshikella harenae TaxID=2827238 RepID=A0ABS5ZAG5_9GAMM|nr:hypothetical protein [Zooshikella harenae]MBU2710878.1 hypothetical protein [Zooshikella harenae]